MKLNINNIDIRKTDLGLVHDYIPQTDWNLSQDEGEQVHVECEYLKVGEKMRYTAASQDGTVSIDYQKLFKAKVKGIEGLEINGKKIVTPSDFLSYPSVQVLDELMMNVVVHILKSDSLTEDETKN